MKSIILASNNKDKVKEVKEILKGYDIISMKEAGIDVDIEENGTTFEENALIKARAIMKLTGQITMADDSGLELSNMMVQLQIRQIMAYGFLVSQFLLVTDSMQSVVQIG